MVGKGLTVRKREKWEEKNIVETTPIQVNNIQILRL